MDVTQLNLNDGYRVERFQFTGNGAEYFRIWIVNLALTIVTLGIYSGWAKVRRLEYFYRNTRLGGSGFDYHGNPIAILKGRAIGLVFFAMYSVAARLGPWYFVASLAIIAAVMPFLLNRALRFRAANSSFRGMRFGFHGTVAGAYRVFLLWPILAGLSLFTLAPLAHQRIKQYQHGNASYGKSRFSIDVGAAPFYGIYVAAFLLIMGAVIGMMIVLAVTMMFIMIASGGKPPTEPGQLGAPFVIGMVVYLVGIFAAQAFVTCRVQNLVWNATKLGGDHRFTSTLRPGPLFRLLAGNAIATVLTLGLFTPFAQVRTARFLIDAMSMSSPDGAAELDTFAADETQDVSAFGEESAGLFDIDIAF